MASDLPRYLMRNCMFYMDRVSKIGQATEIQTPNISLIREEVRNAGMSKARKVVMGFEVEDADIKMTALDPQAIRLIGGALGTEREYMAVGQLVDEGSGARNTATYYMRGVLAELDFGNWQPGQVASHGYVITPNYGKLEIGSSVELEWDDFDLISGGVPVFSTREDLLVL